MKKLIKGLWKVFKESRKTFIILFLIVLGIFIAGNLLFFGISHFPKSCTTCHFMKPYFDQWKASSHNQATCLKCHPYKIPFITVATIKYFTKTYNPRPHANVKDKTCLKGGCHDKRLIESRASLKGGIVFDHNQHWGIKKRGKELRCTSCHYQIVQGGHFAIDNRVCFLCHFKGAGKGRAVTGCPSCHGTPTKIVKHEGFSFSHESYLKIGVKCGQCHLEVTSGLGEVPEEKCHDCHLPREERIEEVDFLHDVHIAQKGYACLQCHSEIKHGQVKMIQALEVTCEKCHTRLHSRQKEIYMGTGGRGVSDIPSRMFSAQVTCDGCHISEARVEEAGVLAFGEKSLRAVKESCVICHGAGYDKMLDDWVSIMNKQIKFVEPYLLQAERLVKKTKRTDIDYEKAVFLVQDARENFGLVRIGRAAHNVEYSVNLLKASLEQAREALEILNRKPLKITPTDILDKGNSYCLALCHSRIGIPPEIKIEKRNIDFPHLIHAEKLTIRCTECHSLEKHRIPIRPEGVATETQAFILKYRICDRCHGEGFSSILAQLGKDEQMKYPGKCTTCHQDVEKISKQVFGLEFSHKNHSERKLSCRRCHSFLRKHGEINVTKQSCASCHHQELQNNCQHCHLPQYNIYWGKLNILGLKGEMDVMAQAEVSCTDCHDLTRKAQTVDTIKHFCVDCHEEGYDDILIGWEKELIDKQNEITNKIFEIQQLIEENKKKGEDISLGEKYLKEGMMTYQIVRKGKGVHNVELSLELLDKSLEKMRLALNNLKP
ncbi:MAG: cytochrome c3 family protein [Candidatus Aminicenantia bacterium]